MYSRTLHSSNSLGSKAASMLGNTRSPRSNSRTRNSSGGSAPLGSSFSQLSGQKPTSFYGQQTHQQQQQASHAPLPIQTTLENSQVLNSGGSVMSLQPSVMGHSTGLISGLQTQSQKEIASPSNIQVNSFKLLCKKHEKVIEKICTKIGCEQSVLLCSECYFESQQHIGMHKEHMFNYNDFINVCKSFSLKHKDDFAIGNKQLSLLLSKLDKQVLKYRNHVKKEEEKIDIDFNQLITEFTNDMEDIKTKLKEQLQVQLDKFQEMAKSLKIKAQDLQQEKESNLDNKNDFDDFLKTVKEIATSKLPSSQNYNFKKLVQNISPLLTRYKDQIQKITQNQQAGNLVINTEQSETLSCFTGMTGYSQLTLNLASQPHLAPIKDLFSDFKELSASKPLYKNKGEGQKLYSEAVSELKRIYYELVENQNLFIQAPKPKLTLDFNKETIDNLTIPEKPEIDELQFIQKADHFALEDESPVSKIEFIKNVNTNHKGGIFALVIVDDDTYVTGSADRTVKVFGLQDHRFIKEVKFSSDITALSTLKRPDGSIMVLVGLYGGFAVLNQGFEIMKLMEGEHEANVNCLVGLKDCETVITASSDPKIVVWNIFNGDIHNRKYFDHRDTIYALELFSCGKFIASGGRDRSIKVWRLQYYKDNYRNGALEKLVLDTNIPEAHSTDVTALKATNICKGFLLSGSANGEIKIWELQDATCVKTIKNSSGWVYKFIIFEQPQHPETEKIVDNQENLISHIAYVASPLKAKVLSAKKIVNANSQTPGSSGTANFNFGLSQSVKSRLISPSRQFNGNVPSNLLSPISTTAMQQKKLKYKKLNEQLRKVQFFTASFDGTLKLWDACSDTPIDSQKSKHSIDCFPFGAVTAFQKDDFKKITVLTTGNKNDCSINIWSIN